MSYVTPTEMATDGHDGHMFTLVIEDAIDEDIGCEMIRHDYDTLLLLYHYGHYCASLLLPILSYGLFEPLGVEDTLLAAYCLGR